MASTSFTDTTDSQASWESGTLTDTEASSGVLKLAKNPVVYRHDFGGLGGWVKTSSDASSISIVPGPGVYGTVAELSGSFSCWYADRSFSHPYDSGKLYEVAGKVRQLSVGTAGQNRVYIGVEGIASDGVTLVNSIGEDNNGSQHYIAIASYTLEPEEGWMVFRGYFQGYGSNPSNHPDPTAPGNLHANVAYFRPMFITNYDDGGGTAQVAWMQVREVGSVANITSGKTAVSDFPEKPTRPVSRLIDGNRGTSSYHEQDASGALAEHVTIDLGALYPINQIGVWHYNSDNRTYHNTRTEVLASGPEVHRVPTPLADYSTWVVGTIGSQGAFVRNGSDSENEVVRMCDPFGVPTAVWKCKPSGNDGADGGWNMNFPCDDTKTYRFSVFVRKRENLAEGSTYLGLDNDGDTETLGGAVDGNPYFWNGDLPSLDRWYLMVGILHPAGYSGGDTGVAGVYTMGGTKTIDGTEYRMASGATTQRMRAYLYYVATLPTQQDFCYPRIDVVDGTEPGIKDLLAPVYWETVFDSDVSGEYAETTAGKWHGLEPTYVRYIRDRLIGSTSNDGDHWLEIEAYAEDPLPDTGTRTSQLSLAPAGRVASATIDWDDRPALMCSTGDNVSVPYDPAHSIANEITIEAEICWMGPSKRSDRSTILTNSRSYYFQVKDDGKLSCYTYQPDGSGSTYFDSNTTLSQGVWYHVAFTEDASGYRRLYIDAVEDAGGQFEAGMRLASSLPEPLGLGKQPRSTHRISRMAIREARLWNYARSSSELASAKGVRLQGNESGLMGYWPLDEASGYVASDLTGNSDGVVQGGRWITYTVETNVSLNGGSTWQGWKVVNKGDSIPDLPADADGYEAIVNCRQTLDSTDIEAPAQVDSLTISTTGSKTLMKRWDGAAWVEHTPKTWQTNQWVAANPRVFTNGRWL